MAALPESITRTWQTGGYYFPEGEPFNDIWDWISGFPVFEIFSPVYLPDPGPRVPDVISEVPQTWEDLEREMPDLFEPILETRPGRVPDPYPQDVSDDDVPEDDEVAHTWGHIARDFLSGIINPPATTIYDPPSMFAPGAGVAPAVAGAVSSGDGCDGMAWSGGTPPKGYKVVNHCGVGVLRKIRRRRRRRMLTASDASDLATIVGIVGKGQMASSMINRTRS